MCTCGMRADVTCASMWGQMRVELEVAGLGKEQVDVLQDLYQRAKQEEMLKNEAPAPALADEDAAAEAVASTQVCHNVLIKPALPCHRATQIVSFLFEHAKSPVCTWVTAPQ